MAIVDLHLHSDKSDGELAPAALVGLAAGAGLRVMALTDHDTTAGLDAAVSAAESLLVCIPGIEITTRHAHEQHILGYNIDYKSERFSDFMARLMKMRRERAENILEYLRKNGVGLSYERTESLVQSRYIGRPQIARAMVAEGYVASIGEAFRSYLSGSSFRKVPRPKPTAEEAIAEIMAAGGVAVLAHPYTLHLDGAELERAVRSLKEQGLGGLECHYGEYSKDWTAELTAIAEGLGLIVTGGSDFHGQSVKPEVEIATGRSGMLDFNDLGVAGKLARRG
ncbi:MAG: PHP domain-containing protein [Clostridiales Family XIII bacterium]|jgi:predicted metal-dependent phosphoesterase TrpH|nr:PHP domain-containing protein [Clostridiales Family XIII bacterium]